MPYEIQLNLQQKAALKIAITFWEKNKVKNKAAEFFKICNKFSGYNIRKKWSEFTKTVVDEWDKDELPQTLEVDLIHLMRMVGQTIFSWYRYIKHEYGAAEDAISFIDKIKWTPYGSVDVVETFKSSWLDNPNLDTTKVYNFACHHAITDHIDDLWHKIPRNKQNDYYEHICKHFDTHILAYWKHFRNNDLRNLMRCCRSAVNDFNEEDMDDSDPIFYEIRAPFILYDLDRSAEENMLRLTVYHGHFIAMKYFWEKLTEHEREDSVVKCARIAVLRWVYYAEDYQSINNFKSYQCLEICIFLMNQMTNQDKKSFYNENFQLELSILDQGEYDQRNTILDMLLSKWPWEELFIPVLKEMLQLQDDDSQMDCIFLEIITDHIHADHELGYSLKTNKYRSLLREVWLIIPASIKQKIPQENRWFSSIGNLINIWDLDSLNLIINDPKITAVRDQFINWGSSSYKQLVVNGQFDKLDQLIEKLFKFDEEQKKSFKEKINPWVEILKDRKFDVADKFLDWQSNTREERQCLKNNINHIELCEKFIKNDNFGVLDEFWNWKFETIEEKIRCKDHFESNIFTIKKIYDIWKCHRRNIDVAKQRSTQFLDWVFESNDEIRCFKKEKLINIEIDQSVINALVMLHKFHIIDEFLSWCLLDATEIKRIKRSTFIQNQRLA